MQTVLLLGEQRTRITNTHTHTHAHSHRRTHPEATDTRCVYMGTRTRTHTKKADLRVFVWWSGGACLAEYSQICLFSARQPHHQISPSSSLRRLMTSSACPLDFGPASAPVMSLPPSLHLNWHHVCCITIPPLSRLRVWAEAAFLCFWPPTGAAKLITIEIPGVCLWNGNGQI